MFNCFRYRIPFYNSCLRLWILEFILQRFLKKKDLARCIRNLRQEGYGVIHNYFSDAESEYLEKITNQVLLKAKSGVYDEQHIEALPGNIKIKHVEQFEQSFKRMSQDIFFLSLNIFFNNKLHFPSIVLTYSTDGSIGGEFVKGACTQQIAGDPHVDSHKPILKIIGAIHSVTEDNGPTAIIPRSFGKPQLYPVYESVRAATKGKQQRLRDSLDQHHRVEPSAAIIPTSILRDISQTHNAKDITLRKNDLALVNTSNIHFARNLVTGERKLIWMYF